MVQKYPSGRGRYWHVRRVEESCCYSRAGTAKAFHVTRAAADRAAERWPGQEVYPCGQHEGRWHLRTKRA